MIEVGRTYKTYGDWEALVIWKTAKVEDEDPSYIIVHKPGAVDEAIAICDEYGVANSMFSVNEPPTYDAHHPADLRWEISKE